MFVNSNCDHFYEGHFEELSKASKFAFNWVVGNIFVHWIMILYALHIDCNYSFVSSQYLINVLKKYSINTSGEFWGFLHLGSGPSSHTYQLCDFEQIV